MNTIQKAIAGFLFLVLMAGIVLLAVYKPEKEAVVQITKDDISDRISIIKNKLETLRVLDSDEYFEDDFIRCEAQLDSIVEEYLDEEFVLAYQDLDKLDRRILKLNENIRTHYNLAPEETDKGKKENKKTPPDSSKTNKAGKNKSSVKGRGSETKEPVKVNDGTRETKTDTTESDVEKIDYEPIEKVSDSAELLAATEIKGKNDREKTEEGEKTSPAKIDINNASREELMQLPGIGEVKSLTIIQYREKNKGFKSVDELMEVSGIGPKTLEKVKPMCYVGTYGGSGTDTTEKEEVKRINLNTATVEDLTNLPRVGPKLAEAIIQYRNENGNFKSLDELKKVPRLGGKTFEAISPYLYID